MDLSQRVLQTNGKLFQISNTFRIINQKDKNIQKDGDASILMKILCFMHHFILFCRKVRTYPFESNSSLWYII